MVSPTTPPTLSSFSFLSSFFFLRSSTVGFGSDIGGYRCCDSKHGPPLPPQGRSKELFLRWAQMGAVCSLMENGGDNDHGPWMFDNQTVDIYRNFVNIHYELKPYLLNAGTTAYYSNVSIMKPVANRTDEAPSTWDYYLWSDIFVSPVVDNVTSQTIEFPDDKSCWVDWFNSSAVFCGPLKVHFKVPIDRFPIFQRQGSVLPLSVTTDDSSFGTSLSADALTVSIPLPSLPAKRHERTILREWKGPSQEIEYLLSAHEMVVRATSHERALLFRLSNTSSIPQSVSLNGVSVPRSIDAHPTASWHFDASQQLLWIHTGPSSPGLSMVINW
ncbi:MAG: glycoside hydrolase family 31 protein [archaeon]|nr:glycoside hydrolase family 31 protein [archaeon]